MQDLEETHRNSLITSNSETPPTVIRGSDLFSFSKCAGKEFYYVRENSRRISTYKVKILGVCGGYLFFSSEQFGEREYSHEGGFSDELYFCEDKEFLEAWVKF